MSNQNNGGLGVLLTPPGDIAQLDVPLGLVIDLILRFFFNYGESTGSEVQKMTRLHHKLVDEVLGRMQFEHLIESHGGTSGLGRSGYRFTLTDEGKARARDAFDRTQYIGPIPVPLEKYNQAILIQTSKRVQISPARVKQSLQHLILPDGFDRRIGPAVNAGSSLFLYGPPGNGKTKIAQAIAKLVAGADPIWLPRSITVGGQIIQLFDELVHKPFQDKDDDIQTKIDTRWEKFSRPFVLVGGELSMESLELRFDPIAKIYEAPLQMKANGGMFLIDDFGRQQMSPTQLLNRWIVPLETQIDLFRLQTGQTFHVPFKQLIVFSTNLDPNTLVDDAFLRRIQMKVEVGSPDEKKFYQIFSRMCSSLGIPFDKESFVHLLREWYHKRGRALQSVHPRDILKVAVALCDYDGTEYRLTPQLIDEACLAYFVQPSTQTYDQTACQGF